MSTIKELINLKGRRAVITGATGSLGKVMADTLAELGANLVLVDQLKPDCEQLCEALKERWGIKVKYFVCDLELQNERTELIAWLKSSGEPLNILINNAAFVGTSDLKGWGVPFEEQTVETWRRALEVNLTSIFDLCQGLMPILKNTGDSSIINIGSIYGVHGPDWKLYAGTSMGNAAAYAASKGGLLQFTRWLSTTIAPNIRVNAISPGGVYRGQSEAFVKRYVEKTPFGRMATEDDFRGAIAYLASDLSKYVTGQNLMVDGGFGVW